MSADNASPSASDVARDLAVALDARGQEYALGGAIALGFWGEPRGTLDVDVTLFLPPDKPAECLWFLQDIECGLTFSQALRHSGSTDSVASRIMGYGLMFFFPSSTSTPPHRPVAGGSS